jgi:hypothetical protein
MGKPPKKPAKKKGLSMEEKQERILKIYYREKTCLSLKEIEKMGVKAGVTYQSIKEVNQSLVDDNFVETDKIGQGVYFWALPSKGRVHREKLLKDNIAGIEKS